MKMIIMPEFPIFREIKTFIVKQRKYKYLTECVHSRQAKRKQLHHLEFKFLMMCALTASKTKTVTLFRVQIPNDFINVKIPMKTRFMIQVI